MIRIEYFLTGKSLGFFKVKEDSTQADRVWVALENDIDDFDMFILDSGRVIAERGDKNTVVWTDDEGKPWITTRDNNHSYLPMYKVDLISLVKGTDPHYKVFKEDLVKRCGYYIGGLKDEWHWHQEILKKLRRAELWWLYMICKESWKK